MSYISLAASPCFAAARISTVRGREPAEVVVTPMACAASSLFRAPSSRPENPLFIADSPGDGEASSFARTSFVFRTPTAKDGPNNGSRIISSTSNCNCKEIDEELTMASTGNDGEARTEQGDEQDN